MDRTPSVSRPVAVRVIIFNLLACAAVNGAAYWCLQAAQIRIGQVLKAQPEIEAVIALDKWITGISQLFWPYVVPATALFFILITLLTWLTLKGIVRRSAAAVKTKSKPAKKQTPEPQTPRQPDETDKRLYLHLITLLQKEGRLLDFFAEDLSLYNDGQIGAAVRNIHENCNKVLRNHISPVPVLDQQEGQEFTVAESADAETVKLTGHVTGKPPFNGIVRHRGWRAGKISLPTFSSRQTTDIIAAAEVEVTNS